jgi:hypothetical protein
MDARQMPFAAALVRLGQTCRRRGPTLTLCLCAALAPFLAACAGVPPAPSSSPLAQQVEPGEVETEEVEPDEARLPGASPAAVKGSPPLLQPPPSASRVVVPELGIDLPVISGDLQPPPNYPLCDVAAYVTRFNQPYEAGITYLSAHAQKGMFLPLLEASQREDGRELLGLGVDVYTNDGVRYRYMIKRVVRHATDYSILAEIPLTERHLILQTSEGVFGTREKLQVVASFEEEQPVDLAEATPVASPRDCRPAELRSPPTP